MPPLAFETISSSTPKRVHDANRQRDLAGE